MQSTSPLPNTNPLNNNALTILKTFLILRYNFQLLYAVIFAKEELPKKLHMFANDNKSLLYSYCTNTTLPGFEKVSFPLYKPLTLLFRLV